MKKSKSPPYITNLLLPSKHYKSRALLLLCRMSRITRTLFEKIVRGKLIIFHRRGIWGWGGGVNPSMENSMIFDFLKSIFTIYRIYSGCLQLSSSSIETIFNWGHLPLRLSLYCLACTVHIVQISSSFHKHGIIVRH